MRRSLAGMRTIITGASGGIGRALALCLAREGARLLLTARREGRLVAVVDEIVAQGGAATAWAGDLAEPKLQSSLVARAQEAWGGIDCLVNNAGVGAFGRFRDSDPASWRQIFEVNFFSAVELTRLSLPLLTVGHRPLIVNVGSILGRRGIPHAAAYCASKFALQGFSESLRAELVRDGIDLLVVNPGTTDTEFFGNVLERQPTPWPEQRGVPARVVAEAIARAMRRGDHEIVPNSRGQMLVWLNRLLPRVADRLLARYG